MLDKYTFGSTPAAIYLVDRLNEIDNAKFTRKISNKINEVRNLLNDVKRAHESGTLELTTLNFIVNALESKVEKAAQSILDDAPCSYEKQGSIPLPDELTVNLMCNIMIGDLKSVKRRSSKVKNLKKQQQRVLRDLDVGTSYVRGEHRGDRVLLAIKNIRPHNITLDMVTDEITPETLHQKMKLRKERRG